MDRTPAQLMCSLLLTVFAGETDPEDGLQELHRSLHPQLDPETYNICMAWAHEQYQLITETRGKYTPSTMA